MEIASRKSSQPPLGRQLPRLLILTGVAGVGAVLPHPLLHAQGVTTVAIRGTVEMADGSDPDGARVHVRSTATGFAVEAEVRRGRFLIQGLESGGPYTLTVRRIGALARRWDGIFLTLGEPWELHVRLEPVALQLDSVVVVTESRPPLARHHGGTATTLPDSLIHRLPSLNRDIYDFIRLVPQISTRIGFAPGGISGGGVGFRFNHFLTNGVSERSLSGAQPPEFAGGRSLPFEAVSEYQVLLAPFDVRYGDFAGALINTVTRSGTNRFGGSVLVAGRNDALARSDLAVDPYKRWQYGLSTSGPILRDRAHFLVAAELQRLTSPMVGPFVGQPPGTTPAVPVQEADLARLDAIFRQYGVVAGSAGAVPRENRLRNTFVRLDAALPEWNSRAVLWVNDADTRNLAFSRRTAPDTFALSTQAATQTFGPRTVALQFHTTLRRRGGGHNELSLSRRFGSSRWESDLTQPTVRVQVPAATGGMTTILAGTPPNAQGGRFRSRNLGLRDDLTLPLAASHVVNLGMEAEWFRVERPAPPNTLGTWTFLSLDSLEAGLAARYELARDLGSASLPITGAQYGVWAGDRWQVGDRLSLTMGLRADVLAVTPRAPYNPTVDSIFGRRTDLVPPRDIHLSPRIGFVWDVRGAGHDRVRGGFGIFTGRPPLAWLHVPLQNHGEGIGTLRCGTEPGDDGLPPPFDPDPGSAPVTCAGGAGVDTPPPGDVELVAPGLRMARTLRAVVAYERRLPGGLEGTVEGLVTRNLSDFVFENLNLAGPQGTDRQGRVLYGTFDSEGRSRPVRRTTAFPSVIELRNVSGNHSVQVSTSLARRFAGGVAGTASYTWSRVRDAQTPLRVNTRGIVNWALTAVSGRHDDHATGISLNDVPHRVVLAGTWRAPWRVWLTELSILYVGESGSPFTWRAGGAGGRGDLNGDGALNDPVYVPRDAIDPDEVLFTGLSSEPGADNSPEAQAARVLVQRTAFERFIESTPCLRRQRGRILARNSCREPWAQTTVASVRQVIPIGRRALEAQLDVFNLLNLLNRRWGQRRLVANAVLLEQVGQTVGPSGHPEPVFRFRAPPTRWSVEPAESAFQLQLGARYRF